FPGRDLVTERFDCIWRGPNEDQVGIFHLPCKLGVLRQEAISGMYHIDIVCESNPDYFISSQVRSHWGVPASLADLVCLVCLLTVQGQSILIAVDSDSIKRELMGGSKDANWDFSGVCQYNMSGKLDKNTNLKLQKLKPASISE